MFGSLESHESKVKGNFGELKKENIVIEFWT